jgi:hypothetical protein
MAAFIQKIIGVQLTPDVNNAKKLQEIFTIYGNIIKTRLGLNHLEDVDLELNAVIILELYGEETQINHFQDELLAVKGLKLGKMSF